MHMYWCLVIHALHLIITVFKKAYDNFLTRVKRKMSVNLKNCTNRLSFRNHSWLRVQVISAFGEDVSLSFHMNQIQIKKNPNPLYYFGFKKVTFVTEPKLCIDNQTIKCFPVEPLWWEWQHRVGISTISCVGRMSGKCWFLLLGCDSGTMHWETSVKTFVLSHRVLKVCS